MMVNVGRNTNSNDVASVTLVTVGTASAVTLALPNPERIHISFCLAFDSNNADVDVAIRAYPAAVDNLVNGEILTRHTAGNANLFRPQWETPTDNPYTGEFSAISAPGSGDVDIIVTEW
jgi:hypothetical protein